MTISTRRILGLVVPMTGEQFLVFGIALFDTAVAGSLGVVDISAQVVVVRWVQFTTVIYNIMSVGGSILVAQAIGQGRSDNADDYLVGALALSALSGTLLMLLTLILSPLLVGVMGVEQVVNDLSVPYLRLMALSFPINFMLLSLAGCVRGAGDARTPLLVLGAANVVHVAAVFILAVNMGLGLHGIGLATLISRAAGLALFLILMLRGVAGLRLTKFVPSLTAARQIWQVGSAVGGEQLALRLGQLVNLRLVTLLGTEMVAAFTVVTNSLSLILTVGLGFMGAALTITGQLVGAGELSRVYATGRRVLALGWTVMGTMCLAFFLFPQVSRLFSSDAGVLENAAAGLRVIVFGVLFETVNQVITGILRGSGDTRYPMLLTALGHWLIRLPLIAILISVGLGLDSIWVAMIVEMAVRAVFNLRRFNAHFAPHPQPEMRPL